ncbi:MAG: SpoIID/LytB domain-containing protein [Spirochaetia bacterium]|nr:SpoIID/LytB domain-containing protein [Spirochaetia bacterium]
MRVRKALFLFVFALFTLHTAFGMTADEAKHAIQGYFQTGEPEKAINLANQFKDTNPDFKRLAFIAAVKAGNTRYAERLLPFNDPDAELNFYIGRYYEEMGNLTKAIDIYTSFQGDNMFSAVSYYQAGRCAELKGDLIKAEIYYDLALASERTYSSARPALARVKEKLGKKEEAQKVLSGRYSTMARGESSFFPPQAKPVKTLPDNFKGKKSGRIVRACLAEKITSFSVTLSQTNEVFNIRYEKGAVLVYNKTKLIKGLTSSYKILNKNGNGTLKLTDIRTRSGISGSISNGSVFRGDIEVLIKDKALMLINHIDLEEYLYGVLPAEMFNQWPYESLKAQAVAARSYILLKMQSSATAEYDVYVGRNTAYLGYNREKPQTTAAVDETFGIALFTPLGSPIDALFCTNSGGYSSSPATAWGSQNQGFLSPVPDKKIKANKSAPSSVQMAQFIKDPPPMYCYVAPHASYASYRWCVQYRREELENIVDPGHTIGFIKGINVNSRDISGRVTSLTVQGTLGVIVIGSRDIRAKLGGLKSSMFVCEYQLARNGLPNTFMFIGGGWGHGVGMCQTGAAGMAVSGIGFKDILKHYYPEAIIKNNCY